MDRQICYDWGSWRSDSCLTLSSSVHDHLATGHCHPQARTISWRVARQYHLMRAVLHLLDCSLTGCAVPATAPSCLQFQCHSLHSCIAELRVWSRALDTEEAGLMSTCHTSLVLLPTPCRPLSTCPAGCAASQEIIVMSASRHPVPTIPAADQGLYVAARDVPHDPRFTCTLLLYRGQWQDPAQPCREGPHC